MRKPWRKIQWKLVFMILFLFLLFSLVNDLLFTSLSRAYMVDHYHHSQMQDCSVIAQHLSQENGIRSVASISALLSNRDNQHDLKLYESLIESDLWIFDENGNMYSSTNDVMQETNSEYVPAILKDTAAKVLQGSAESSTGMLDGVHIMLTGVSIKINGETRGCVLVSQSIENLRADSSYHMSNYLAAQILSLLLAVTIAVVFAMSFTQPIVELQEFSGQLASGALNLRSHIKRSDEIGQLAKAMDSLAAELEKAELERSRLEQSKRTFLAEISHELKTPVTVIRGSLEALSDQQFTDEQTREQYYKMMLGESISLQAQIEDLLDLTRLQSDAYSMPMEDVDFSDMISDVLMSMKVMAREKEITISCPQPESEYIIQANYDRLRQVLMILADNAIKYSPPGAEIRLHFSAETGTYSIENPGERIPDEKLRNIFSPYERSSRDTSGTGLGLAIARTIADRHGFGLYVENTAHGVRFSLKF